MSPRQILLNLAAVLVVAGMVMGFRTIHAGDNSLEPVNCGSVFQPDKTVGQFSDEAFGGDDGADCDKAISGAKPLAYGATGLGVVALIAGFVAPSSKPRTTEPNSAQQ